MAGYWLKLYTEILDDPKYYRLSDNAKLGMIELMLVAKKINGDGYIPPIDELNFYTRRSNGWWEPVLEELKSIQFIVSDESSIVIRKFEERQSPVSGIERARLSRELKNTSKIEPKYKPNKYDEICRNIPHKAGVYFIYFPERNIGYIGASKDMSNRFRKHLTEMSDYRHGLYSAYSDLGLDGLKIEILEETDDLSKLAELEIKQIKAHESTCNLINNDGYKPNRHWKKAYDSYGETETETETEKIKRRGETDLIAPANFSDSRPVIETNYARVWTDITGMPGIPQSDMQKVIAAIDMLRPRYKSDDGLVAYLKPYYAYWLTKKTKGGRAYSKSNCAWLYDLAVAGDPLPGSKQPRERPDPNCPKCGGVGMLRVEIKDVHSKQFGNLVKCECVKTREELEV